MSMILLLAGSGTGTLVSHAGTEDEAEGDGGNPTYTVTWKAEGKILQTDENVPYGSKVTFRGEVPIIAGSSFTHWED